MKIYSFFKSAPLAALLLFGSMPSQAAPSKLPAKVKKGAAVKHAEEILGKPLNLSQLAAIHAAQKERAVAMKPIQQKFKAKMAKVLGMSLAQLEAREKAIRAQKDAKKG